jgi:hypothetical protein
MKIDYIKIQSSNIIGYAYFPKTKLLYIQFGNGRSYEYSEVTQEEINQLKEAESFGKKLREIIITQKKHREID